MQLAIFFEVKQEGWQAGFCCQPKASCPYNDILAIHWMNGYSEGHMILQTYRERNDDFYDAEDWNEA